MTSPSPVRIDPETEVVRKLTAQALAASQPSGIMLTLRCSKCGEPIAWVGRSAGLVLFVSTWAVEIETGVFDQNLDRKLTNREYESFANDTLGPVVDAVGPPMATTRADGVIAILALPPGSPDDYPALLVRCSDHGDKVLDRLAVLAMLRRGKDSWPVSLTSPLTAYVSAEVDWLNDPISHTSSETRRSTQIT